MPKIKFEKTLLIGSGKITWYQKAERWVRRKFKNPFTQHLLLGIIKYLQTQWINAKIYNTMKDVDADIEKSNLNGKKMTNKQDTTSWREEYLEMKPGLSKLQTQLLKEGPKQLAQAWLLGAMHQDYDRMKGIKRDYPKENKGQMQSSLKDFFERIDQRDQGI